MIGFSRILAGVAMLAVAGASASAQDVATERRAVAVADTDFFGGDIETVLDSTLEDCEALCLSDARCVAFTFNTRSNACFPKSEVGEMRRFEGAVSARIVDIDAGGPESSDDRAKTLDFLPADYLAEARLLLRSIGLEHPQDGRSPEALLVAAREATDRKAADLFAMAAAADGRAPAWIGLAQSLLKIERGSYSQRTEMERRASAAAVNAYLGADEPSDRARALSVLASAMQRRGEGRRSIDALRLSLEIEPRAETRRALERAVDAHGFRVTDLTVDSNAARPRICVAFSETLRDGFDYAPYLRLDRRDLPVEAEGQQLCVDGVEHGERYRLTARKGLPAASGEVLHRPYELETYIRDREPAVRFTGRAHILPKSAEASIPVVTVNLDEVAVRIHRVGPRNLRSVMRDDLLGGMLDGYGEGRISRELGTPLWEGTGEVERALNQDVTTALPIGDAIARFEPGVHVMTARAAGAQDWENAATQWFVVTDLGLTTLSGSDGLHVFVRSLAAADAVEKATLNLVAANNEVLGTATSDARGYARFAPGLTRGTGGSVPALVTVETAGGDFAFIDLTEGAFDLSDRGVEGRAAPGPVDVFLTTERGVYRPGETVHATILARDAAAKAVTGLPLTAIVTRPDGVEHSRNVLTDAGAGGRAYSFDLAPGSARGGWDIAIHLDPEAPALARETFLVEDFTPERIDVRLDMAAETIRATDIVDLKLEASYLYGAPSADLPIAGEVRVSGSDTLAGFPGYRFGPAEGGVDARSEALPEGLKTDANGMATIPLALPAIGEAMQPLTMEAILRVREGSGRPVERVLERPLLPTGPLIGIKPLFDGTVKQGGLARFEVLGVDRDGDRATLGAVDWELARIETRYQWYEIGGSWRYEPVTRRERVASGEVELSADGPAASVEIPVDWGRYELKVIRSDGDYAASSLRFDAGWYAPVAGSDTPDTLQVSLDKDRYAVGETAKLRLDARFPGTVLVAVMDHRLIETKALTVEAGATTVDVPVTGEWGPGAYIGATLIRPMDVEAGRNPSRAIGIAWAETDPGERLLEVSFDAPDKASPRQKLDARIEVGNLPAGTQAYATIAAVDVGVLNVTGFEAPEPTEHYFGQRRLGVEMRDLYGRLIDGTLGTPGRLRSGGDTAASGRISPPPNEDVVAFFSGVLEIDDSGAATARFDLPDFNGTLRLMAVVWSEAGVGDAVADVTVADPVVVSASVPRFLAPGDESRMLVELDHASGPTGAVTVELRADAGLSLGETVLSVDLEDRESLLVPVTANEVGDHEIRLVTTTPDGRALTKTIRLPVRANDPPIQRRNRIALAADGGTLRVDSSTFDGFRDGTATATLTLGPLARFDVAGLLRDLDRYPYGCTEQLTSRALPLLYFDEVARAMGLDTGDGLAARVEKAVGAVLANQNGGGSFGLWRPAGGDGWLDAYVTDFLSRARAAGHDVPEPALEAALANLRNRIAYAGDFEQGGEDLAYALQVLAREGMASIGDLRYFADAKAEALGTPLAQAQIGAALASYGEQQRADRMFRLAEASLGDGREEKPGWRSDYGTRLRDAAGVLALAVEAGSEAVDREALTGIVTRPPLSSRLASTQEQLWSLLAAHALVGDARADVEIDGLSATGPLVRIFDDETFGNGSVTVENTGDARIDAVLTTFGVPVEPPEAGGNGYRIERAYYTLDGEEVGLEAVAQNTRLIAVLTVKSDGGPAGRLMIDDPLPAGLEIDNPSLLRAGEIASVDWLAVRDAEMTEFRSDRFLAAVNATEGETFELAYIVRAVSPGRFHHPAASVEDMYRPDYRANTGTGRVEVLGPLE